MGYTYIIPTDIVEYVSKQLMDNKKYERSSFGVVIRDLFPIIDDNSIKYQNGVYIHSVKEGSAAAKSGLMVDDVILTFNGQLTKRPLDLSYFLLKTKPYDKITLGINRNGLLIEKDVILGKRNHK